MRCSLLAVAVLGVAGASSGACARGRCGPPFPIPATVAQEEVVHLPPRAADVPSLPAGCVRLTDGAGLLSPDGRLLSSTRWHTITGTRVPRAERALWSGLGSEPLIPELWVLDVGSRAAWAVPGWAPTVGNEPMRGGARLPVAWTPLGSLVLSDGTFLDARTGATTTADVRPPPGASLGGFLDGEVASSWAWTADGRRLAFLAERTDVHPRLPGEMRRRAVYLTDGAGHAARLAFDRTPQGRPLDEVTDRLYLFDAHLAWSRPGDRLFFRLGYIRNGDHGADDFERVGCYDVVRDRAVVLEELPWLDRAPDRRSGRDVWDAAGRTCAYVVAMAPRQQRFGQPWDGRMDVHVADAETGIVRAVTDDGVEKGRPCLDPAGRRVAFFVGPGAARGWGAAGKDVRLRVLHLEDGHVRDTPLAPAPDEGAPLGELQWVSGGGALLYGYGGVEGATYLQSVPAR